ncbi:hypothetical protein B0T25DRAFT_559538 [Lasiosphaeria hispida]|uniref:Uncharacterized protein n=1 Tax=Lasiosphaeria hispida TaxID=260671 RepID=A0AAJ0M8K3_9PEZI|nr:hypothetical protein B0T25DRAFT_559538 [Lasiosphaeria hispida]
MPTLVAVDVSVSDDHIRLVFSHRAIAQAYAKYLEAEDRRPPQSQPIPGYRRNAHYNPSSKEITVALPKFLTWFITCRLPDDEDSVTFTFMDADEQYASRWADSMLLFEAVPGPTYDESVKQLHVRRLWNKAHLQKRLDELARKPSPNNKRGPSPRVSNHSGPTRQAQREASWW